MFTKPSAVACAVVLVAATLATGLSRASADPPTPAPQASVSGVLIIVRAFGFVPSSVSVAPGTTVTFRNDDNVNPAHTVASTTGAFGPQSLGYGMSFKVTLNKPGKYPFNAADAPFMKGVITVTDSSSSAPEPAPAAPSPAAGY